MINKINNSTNFCGSNIEQGNIRLDDIDTVFKMRDLKRAHERELQEIRNAQEEFRAKNNASCDTFVSTKKENAKKAKKSVSIPAALSAAAILLSLGIKTGLIALDNDGDIELPSSSVVLEQEPQPAYEIEIVDPPKYSAEEIQYAIDTIKSDPDLKKAYYDMILTINNMSDVFDNPVEVLNSILNEPYASNTDIEYVLAQIFAESNGQHFDENGEVLTSGANCNGYMQMSKAATEEMNNRYFEANPQDRNDPLGNLKLGIALDNYLIENSFPNDLFNATAAYNCGVGNAKKGNYIGADKYAQKVLGCYQILKDNPLFTQMLLDGELNEYQDEFIYF